MKDQEITHVVHQKTKKASPPTPSRGRTKEASVSRWEIGDKIGGRYEVHNLKMGGMGIVYLCYDPETQKPIVLKTFQDVFLFAKSQVERFMWEAETWVRLEKHMNIVRAYYVEQIEDKPYIFLEYIMGEEPYGPELSSWILEKGLNLTLSLNFAIQFCCGMLHAQKKFEAMERPFVHRDIKPSNIMITRDRIVKVTDFGLVRAFQGMGGGRRGVLIQEKEGQKSLSFTHLSAVLGTPAYMAPEQWLGEDIDTRADIYAFGCVLYQMLSGHPPFVGNDWPEYQVHHLETRPQPIPSLSRSLNGLILKCLEKKPERRFHNFKEIRDELQDFHHALTDEYVEVEEDGEKLEAWELLNKGVSLDNLGYHQEAIECYHEAIRLSPQDAKLYNNRGAAYRALGNHELALKDFDTAIQLNPWYPHAYSNRGNVYSDLGQREQALKDFDMAIQLNPWYPYTYNNRGLVYFALGQNERATKDFDMAIRFNPKDADAYNNRGIVYRALGQYEKAIRDFEEALRLNPNNPKAVFNRGLAYRILGQCEQAIKDFDEAIRLNPHYSKAYYHRGLAYATLGLLEKALQDFDMTVQFDPSSPHNYHHRGLVYHALGLLDRSLKDFDEAISRNPWVPQFYTHRGIVLLELGWKKWALENFHEAIKIDPQCAEAYYHRASVLEQMDPKEALEAWTDYLQLARDLPEKQDQLAEVQKRIHDLQKKLSCPGGNEPSPGGSS